MTTKAIALMGVLQNLQRTMNQGIAFGILFCALGVGALAAAEGGQSVSGGLAPSPGRPLEYEEPRFLAAAINGQGSESGKLLFKFEREAVRSGNKLNVQRDYAYPDGKLAARERAVYEGNDLVLYELQETQIGARGSARIQRVPGNPAKGTIEFEYSKAPGEAPSTSTEALAANTLIGDMVAPFLVSHWEELSRGAKVKCRYIVVPRRETVGFNFVKDTERSGQDAAVVVIRMEAASPFIAVLVDPGYFTMEKAPPHRVLQFVGRTVPKMRSGTKWKDLDAVTVFDWKTAH